MTENVCLTLPAAALAAPTPAPAGRRGASCARDLARDAAVSLARAETRLREVEARARARAGTRAGRSNEAIVARARALMAESGGALNAIDAGDKAHAEAATLAAGNRNAREQQAWERRQAEHERVKDTVTGVGQSLASVTPDYRGSLDQDEAQSPAQGSMSAIPQCSKSAALRVATAAPVARAMAAIRQSASRIGRPRDRRAAAMAA